MTQTTAEPSLMFRGPVPTNSLGLPHYCSAIWIDGLRRQLADSTRARHVGAIQQLYDLADSLNPQRDLDAVLVRGDLDDLEAVLTAYLLRIRATSEEGSIAAKLRWKTALRFVADMLAHMSHPGGDKLEAKLARLQQLYSQLSPTRPRGPIAIRALPAVVVEELYALLNPTAPGNPFRSARNRWRNFAVYMCLLHLGLRAGELLSLSVEALRSEFDPSSGETRFWLNVIDDLHTEDPRARKPRLKNSVSVRQVPLPSGVAELLEQYVCRFRGDPTHSFLFNSQEEAPFAYSSLLLLFRVVSERLAPEAKIALENRDRDWITPHDLRHTSAVVRLQRYRLAGLSQDEAIEKLRPFFGWARESKMPLHYARAYFEPRFQDTWDESFALALEALRAATGGDL